MNNKDFDTRYIRRDKTTNVSADTNIQHGKGFNILLGNGSTVNLIKSDLSGNTILGNANTALKISSNGDMTHNGSKIWTAANDGAGSGLDADLLGGVPSSRYLTTDSNGQFSNNITFNEGITLGENKKITWKDKAGISVNTQSGNTITSFTDTNGATYASLNSSTGIHSSALSLTGGAINSSIEMKGKASDRGFLLSVDKSTGELKLVNSQNGAVLFNAGKESSEIGLGKHVMINGRHVYIQKEQPPLNVPEGSVWIQIQV